MTATEKVRLRETSRNITCQMAALRDENKVLKKERDLWKARALALAAAVELLDAEMALK